MHSLSVRRSWSLSSLDQYLTILAQELDANLIAKLPIEIVHRIFLAAANHLDLALALVPVSSWVYSWVAPALYRRVKLATDNDALNFLTAIKRIHPVEPRNTFVL